MLTTKTVVPTKYDKRYTAEIDLVAHEHWVALYKDSRGRNNIRLILGEDAWKYDIQVGMTVEVEPRPFNRCKIIKAIQRPV
jgi:hypothetical protein